MSAEESGSAGAAGDRDGASPGTPAEEEDPTWPFVGVLLAVLWLFVNGVPLRPAPLAGQVLVGLAFGLPVAYVSRRFYWPETDPWRLLRAAPYMVLYVAVFVKDLLVANVDVAYRVLAPSMPIDPSVVDLPLRVESDVAITTIANSITLTPGTLTMDYDADRNALTVHTIAGGDPEAVARPIRRWEDYALVIFDERLKPGDPAPEPAETVDGVEDPDAGGDGDGR